MSDFFIEIKTQCQAELACPEPVEGKTDERMLKVSKKLNVTLRLVLCVTLRNRHPSTSSG
jgi:hypothetical protein